MKHSSVLLQVILLLCGLGIIFFYAYPEFTNIRVVQDQIQEYNTAIAEADEVNNLLQQLVSRIEGIPSSDRTALTTFLPSSIDPVFVQRDIQRYVDLIGMDLRQLSYNEQDRTTNQPWVSRTFQVSAAGSYTDVKRLVAAFEANAYLLRPVDMRLTTDEEEEMLVTLTLRTFAFPDLNE